jgi:hypothetical protein
MTKAFVTQRVQGDYGECWIPILRQHLGTKQFIEGIDYAKLKAAYEALTGRTDFPPQPAPVPPAPGPTPDPVPPAPTPTPTPTPIPTPVAHKVDVKEVGSWRYYAAVNGKLQGNGHPKQGEAFQEAANLVLSGALDVKSVVTIEVGAHPSWVITAK